MKKVYKIKKKMVKIYSRDEYHNIKWDWIYEENDCPFCDTGNLTDNMYYKWKYWFLLHNFAPYCWDERHLMAIPYDHIKYSRDLTKNHFDELAEIHKIVKDFFKNQSYFSFTRETMDSRSVEHLHMHFLVWKVKWSFLRKMLEMQGYPIKQNLEIN